MKALTTILKSIECSAGRYVKEDVEAPMLLIYHPLEYVIGTRMPFGDNGVLTVPTFKRQRTYHSSYRRITTLIRVKSYITASRTQPAGSSSFERSQRLHDNHAYTTRSQDLLSRLTACRSDTTHVSLSGILQGVRPAVSPLIRTMHFCVWREPRGPSKKRRMKVVIVG